MSQPTLDNALMLMHQNTLSLADAVVAAHGALHILDDPDTREFLILLAKNNIMITAKYIGDNT